MFGSRKIEMLSYQTKTKPIHTHTHIRLKSNSQLVQITLASSNIRLVSHTREDDVTRKVKQRRFASGGFLFQVGELQRKGSVGEKRMAVNEEAVKYVWEGAIPLQIHLHKSEVASHPAPPPALVLAPRIGYLPLLVHLIKPYFNDSLPPGEDSIWFDYKGLPLKWYIPTGVLFDLLCAEPERPWNLTIHFRGYPSNVLIPCEGEDSVKWNFVNSLKEAAYIINGNCKNVMNMSQSDQEDLWTSVMNGDLDAYTRLSPKIKMGNIEDEFSRKASLSSVQPQQGASEIDGAGQVKTARIPVRLYVRSVSKDFENLEDVPEMDSWDEISYLNRPVEFFREDGKCFTLRDAIQSLLPEYIGDSGEESEERSTEKVDGSMEKGEIKLVRIQGIEMKLEIPFSWVVNNLMNPEFYLHISVLVKEPLR